MAESPRLLVTLCTYNERENIEPLMAAIQELLPAAHLLVVDDNSPDGTWEFVAERAQADDRIHLIHRAGKLGLGSATVAAFQFGIERGYDLLLNMDADFSHPPRFMPDLVAATQDADVAIGSRYIPGGSIENWGAGRRMMSWGINCYARLLLGLKNRDNSGSFRCYRVEKLREVNWSHARARGYAIQEEILYRLKRAGATFQEVPIHFEERRFGSSKITWQEAVGTGWTLLRIRWK